MKHFFLFTIFVAVMSIAGPVLSQGFKIVALDEVPGRTMNAGTFSSADPEAVKKYMPGGTAPASVTTFILFAGEDTVLFDAGLGGETWSAKMAELGVKPENVKLILLTHYHSDHIGGLMQGNVRRFPHAKVLSSVQEYEAGQQQQPIVKIRSAYGQDFITFKFDDDVFANSLVHVKAIDAVGHTPGHSVFLIESKQEGKEKFLIVGDLLHAAALQFPVPEACASYDADQAKAIASRKRILDFAAQEKLLIGGMHLPPPSVGTVKKEDKGYAFDRKE